MVPLKEWNFFEISVGRPGSGKSYWMRQRVWEEARRTGAYVIVHDPTGSWSERAGHVPNVRHQTLGALQAGLKQHGGRVAHVVDVADADTVLRAGLELARVNLSRAVRGKYAPTIVVVDEAVAAEGIDPHGLSPFWRDVLARRRHLGIGVGITAQSAYFCHRSVSHMATRIEVFALSDPADAKRLVAAGLDYDLAERLRELPDRQSITIEKGRVTRRPDCLRDPCSWEEAQAAAKEYSKRPRRNERK